MWNQLVDAARKNDDRDSPIIIHILKQVRQIYVALHNLPETDPLSIHADDDRILNEVSSYPRCTTHSHDHDSAAASPRLAPDTSLTATRAIEGTAHILAIPPLPLPSPSCPPITTTQYGDHSSTPAPPTSVSRTPVSSHQIPALTYAPSTRGEPLPQDSTASSRSTAASHLISVPNRDVTAKMRITDPPPPAPSAALVDGADTSDKSTPSTISRSRGPPRGGGPSLR